MSTRKFILVFGGYGQHPASDHGTAVLYHKLRAKFSSDEHTTVLFVPWSEDADELHMRVYRLWVGSDVPPKMIIACFSWGASTAQAYLRVLEARLSWQVHALVLCDPVLRGPWWYMAFLFFFRTWFSYCVPENVKQVWTFHQNNSRPQGYLPLAENDATKIHPAVLLNYRHEQCDNAPEFHKLVMKVAA